MTRTRAGLIATAVLAAAGLAAGLSVALGGGHGTAAPTSSNGSSAYRYYQSEIRGLPGGSMMGASNQAMMGPDGYTWITGGTSAPGWMRGDPIPGSMMGLGDNPGTIMGTFWADAPGPRVTATEASTLGNQTPIGTTVDTAAARINFTTQTVHLVVLASPAMPDENFRIAGMVNPTIIVPVGAHVSIQLINADTDMVHGLVITGGDAANSPMPMTTTSPAFPGSALWFLGEATPAGMHAGTLAFTATTPGTYQYLCPVPGHAQEGMIGTFAVTS